MTSDIKINLNTEEMARAGVNFGHTVSKLHPKMKEYVFGVKSNVHMIDLSKTAKDFQRALNYISGLVKDGKTILFVGTKAQVKNLVKNTAEEINMPYV